MTSIINVLDIEKRHRRTLKNYNEARHCGYDEAPYSRGALFLSYILPILISFSVGFYFWKSCTFIKGGTLGVLVSVFSVFTGFLLNVLVLMYRIAREEDSSIETEKPERDSGVDDIEEAEQRLAQQKASAGSSSSVARELPSQAYSNVSYSILVCIVSLIILLISSLFSNVYIGIFLSLLIVFLVVHFIITLLMVVRRMHAMLFQEMGIE